MKYSKQTKKPYKLKESVLNLLTAAQQHICRKAVKAETNGDTTPTAFEPFPFKYTTCKF